MAKFDCVDSNCYTPETCASIIDTYGGPKSLAFFDATSLASCDRASGCSLDCTNQPPLGTGGITGVGGQRATGGRTGSSGFVGSGSIGGGGSGGSGATIQDGGIDLPIKKGTTEGGCGCTVPKERTSGWSTLAALACLGLAAGRRKRRYSTLG
jgi:MYXO-CTERM domain-containing protein